MSQIEKDKPKLGQEPAFPISEEILNLCGEKPLPFGMSKRFYAACNSKDDVMDFNMSLIGSISDEPKPDAVKEPKRYMEWCAKVSVKWRYMKADELLRQESE